MNYHNIKHDDMLNGTGLRVTLFVSGCDNHCKGCQNPQTWDATSGVPFDDYALAEILYYLDKPYTSGLTLSGGDPLFVDNVKSVEHICAAAKAACPGKTIWAYTGHYWDDVKGYDVMKYIDVLVEGPYKEELRNTQMHWAGSTNQRIIDVGKTLECGNIVLWKEN